MTGRSTEMMLLGDGPLRYMMRPRRKGKMTRPRDQDRWTRVNRQQMGPFIGPGCSLSETLVKL